MEKCYCKEFCTSIAITCECMQNLCKQIYTMKCSYEAIICKCMQNLCKIIYFMKCSYEAKMYTLNMTTCLNKAMLLFLNTVYGNEILYSSWLLQPFQHLTVVTYWLNMTIHSDICPSVPKVLCIHLWWWQDQHQD